MKKLILIPALFCLFMLNVASMCSSNDDDNSSSTSTVTGNVTSGTWRVTHFNGYNFTINNNGTLEATNGSVTKNGTWSTYSDSGSTKFEIAFPDTDGPFEEITEDWRVLFSSATKLELKHVSGGDGSIDYLTFQKN
jgi:hypothetical protein